jgi:hypothetical protein
MIGSELSYDKTKVSNTVVDITAPFRYDLQFQIQSYSGNALERAKVEGSIYKALLTMMHDGIPVYEFLTETSAVTAYDTGSRIYITSMNQLSRVRSENVNEHDYATLWTVNAKCIYIFQTITSLVTAVSAVSTINWPLLGSSTDSLGEYTT